MSSMSAFGPGAMIVKNALVANPTPFNIGYCQEFSLDFAGSIKELYGQNQFPIDVARGTVKVSAKAKSAVISGGAWNTAFFGMAMVAGTKAWALEEAGTVPGTPFTITVANGANFNEDLGVKFAATNLPLTRVASAPAAGQYSVNTTTGVYTFNTADTAKGVLISYAYNISGSGQTLSITNQILGASPTFQLDFWTVRSGKAMMARFPRCQCPKLSFATKLEDFVNPEFDISMYADPTGNIGTLFFPEIN